MFDCDSTIYYNLIGGVMSINRENFYHANGFSNVYWGWGSEDDDFSARSDTMLFTVHINGTFLQS